MTRAGFDYTLDDRYCRTEGQVLLTGIQALARIPIDQLRRDRAAGLNTAAFLSGYPGSPLGGFDQEVARARRLVPDLSIVHRPAVNEELGATSVMGSQLAPGRPDATVDGVVGFWYGKAPGLDRAGDALRHGVFAGSSALGGAVVIVGDDPACKSSTMPSSSDATLVDLHMPILYPGTSQECLELGLHAVAMSRATGLWTSMKIVTPVADGSGTVRLPALTSDPIQPTIEVDGVRWSPRPSAVFLGQRMIDVEREFREVRLPLARQYGIANGLNRIPVDPADAWIGLVATGFTYVEVLDALRRLGFADERAIAGAGIRLLQLRMPVPFDTALVRRFARGLDEIVVIEEKNATLEMMIRDALYGSGHQPNVVGKHHEDGRVLMRSWGMLDTDAMLDGLQERLARRLADRLVPLRQGSPSRKLIPLSVTRTPFFCSGCPHNWGTKVPAGVLVGAGTGCHGMTLLMDPERVGDGIGITAMGNEGAQWIGMAPFVESDHLFQNYGDGTFFHSAQLALQYCIGAGMHMTFKILHNGTVAMTGGQDATFQVGVPELATMLLAQGVSQVAITTDDPTTYRSMSLPPGVEVTDRREIVAVQERLRSVAGVTVLIHDQACAAELRRDRKRDLAPTPTRRVVINHRICEGCGDCGDISNCLSVQPIETPLGRKTTIDQASCNFDFSCLDGDCPAFMTVEVETGHGGVSAAMQPPPVADVTGSRADRYRLRLAGIGGTGVVTVAQILATAAMLDGWEVSGLDQTGLSQKAGPVISDVVLSRDAATASNLIGAGEADLILGFDALVAVADASIAAAGATTVVIASSHRTPTGRMISHPEMPYPDAGIADRVAALERREDSRLVDATELAIRLVGSAAQANVFLLGVAYQEGRLPVSAAAIDRAIELNGVAVDNNRAAFGWGRVWSHDPAGVESIADRAPNGAAATIASVLDVPVLSPALAAEVARNAPEPLVELVTMLAADLVAFQDEKLAMRFCDVVGEAAGHERRVAAGSTALTEAVARNLHKLSAYKDEYEVARLMLLPESRTLAQSVGGPRAQRTWQLHPPILAAMGRNHKIGFGERSAPLFRALRAGKGLRGTAFDPFGRTQLRRIEQNLPGEYLAAMGQVYASLRSDNLADAVAIAELPDMIRGYEALKLRRITEFRTAVVDRVAAFTGG